MRSIFAFVTAVLPLIAVPAYADCTDEVRAALVAISASGPYRMVGVTADKDMSLDVFSEIVPPNAMFMRNKGEGFYNEVTVRDGRAWSSDGNGWVELEDSMAAELAETVSQHALSNFDGLGEVKCLGEVHEGGQTLLAYTLGLAGAGKSEHAEVRVDPDSGRPVRVRVVGNLDGRKSSADMSIVYDPAITVALPPGF